MWMPCITEQLARHEVGVSNLRLIIGAMETSLDSQKTFFLFRISQLTAN
jgi:hypothetical protein